MVRQCCLETSLQELVGRDLVGSQAFSRSESRATDTQFKTRCKHRNWAIQELSWSNTTMALSKLLLLLPSSSNVVRGFWSAHPLFFGNDVWILGGSVVYCSKNEWHRGPVVAILHMQIMDFLTCNPCGKCPLVSLPITNQVSQISGVSNASPSLLSKAATKWHKFNTRPSNGLNGGKYQNAALGNTQERLRLQRKLFNQITFLFPRDKIQAMSFYPIGSMYAIFT